MQRRQWFRQIAWGVGSGALLLVSRVGAQSRDFATLQEKLEAGLRARRPEEFAYIAMLVDRVRHGLLPEQLVLNVFNWARKKNVKYPFQYFVRALPILAARVGIYVPPFVEPA